MEKLYEENNVICVESPNEEPASLFQQSMYVHTDMSLSDVDVSVLSNNLENSGAIFTYKYIADDTHIIKLPKEFDGGACDGSYSMDEDAFCRELLQRLVEFHGLVLDGHNPSDTDIRIYYDIYNKDNSNFKIRLYGATWKDVLLGTEGNETTSGISPIYKTIYDYRDSLGVTNNLSYSSLEELDAKLIVYGY